MQELDLWTKDYDDLKRRLEERDVDVSQDKTWSQLVDKAVTAYIEPRLIEPSVVRGKNGRVEVPSWSDVLLGVQAPAASRGRRRS